MDRAEAKEFGNSILDKLLANWVVVADDYSGDLNQMLPIVFRSPEINLSLENLIHGQIVIIHPSLLYRNRRFVSPDEAQRLLQEGYDIAAQNIFNNKTLTQKERHRQLNILEGAAKNRGLKFNEKLITDSVPEVLSPAEKLARKKAKLESQLAEIAEKQKSLQQKDNKDV